MINNSLMVNRVFKLILSLALAAFSVACSSSPATISGVVRDGSNGRELYRVKITTKPATLPALTTSRGRFSIDRQVKRAGGSGPLETRAYTIIIEHEGYERYEREVRPDADRDLEIKLRPEKSIIDQVDLGVGGDDRGPIHTGDGPKDDTM